MALTPLSLNLLIPDIKSDLVKSFVMGVLAIIVTAILSVASEAMPSEFKQPAMIVAFGLIIALLSLTIILIKRHSSDIKIIASLVFSMLLITVISIFAFFNYTYKGLFFESNNPIFIVFYPEQVSSPTLQNSIESSVRGVPERLKGGKDYFSVKKVVLPEKFDFEHSLLKNHVDKLASVISYVLLIPEGEKVFVKTGFPAGLPYLKMGFQSVETTSVDTSSPSFRKQDIIKHYPTNSSHTEIKQSEGLTISTNEMDITEAVAYVGKNNVLEVEINGYFEHFIIGLRASQEYSKIHYGLKRTIFKQGSTIGWHQNKISSSDLLTSSLNPVNGGAVAESNTLSGSIYFSLVSGMIDYYRVIGENKMSCTILLEDYLGFDQIENVKKNLNFFPKERLFNCLKNISLENKKPLFDLLTAQQKNELQKNLLDSLIKGQKTQEYLIKTGLYDDKKAIELTDQLGKICRSKTNFNPNIFDKSINWNFASCLHNLLQQNYEIINKHPVIKNNSADIIKNFYEAAIIGATPNSFLYYVERLKNLYGILEQEDKFCESEWSSVLMSANWGEQRDFNSFLDVLTHTMEQIAQISNCEKINMFDLNIKGSKLNQISRDMLKKLVDNTLTDWKNDVTVFTLLNHIQTDLLALTNYLEIYEAETIIKEVFYIVLHNPEDWLEQEINYLKQRVNFPEEISDTKIPSDIREKISLLFKDISINHKISDWKNLLKKSQESKPFMDIDKNKLLNLLLDKSKVIDDYFIDSLTHQFFAVFKSAILAKDKGHFVIERKKGKIYNRTLDKMILFFNLQNRNINPKQRSQMLQAIKDEHEQTDTVITDAQLKHYEFYVGFKDHDTVKALEALNSLIAMNESPYVDFYRFAKTVIESPNTINVCQNSSDTAEKILDHLLSDDFIFQDWDGIYSNLPSTENSFNNTLERYLVAFVRNRKIDNLTLATAFENCGRVAKFIENTNKPKKRFIAKYL